MADPLTAIGAVSAVVQLIGGVASGLRTLKDAVVAIKDAQKAVERLEKNILHLGQCLKMLEQYFQQRPPKIPYEAQLYEVIQGIATSCTAPLNILKEKTPKRVSKKNAATAFHFWLNDSSITQAKLQIDEYIPYMNLLMQTLNLTFANDATAFVVQSVSTTTATSSRYMSALRPGDAPAVSGTAQVPPFPKAREQLDAEWEQNRKDLERLVGYGLYENAEKLQRRALLIKEELNSQYGIPFKKEERDEMEERLADILIECKVEGSTEKAVSLIENIIGENPKGSATGSSNNRLTLPWSSTSDQNDQKKLNLHYKLGGLYKETGQMDLAERELRTAFNAYAYSEESPQDIPKIRQAGEELSELYECRVEFGDREHRSVFLSQQKAFEQELRTILGRPLEHRRTICDKALEWCEKEGINVSFENSEPRFDIVDEDGSSPLHHAAEKCDDDLALQQMMENSDTLENQDLNGDTPLLVAVGYSNTAALAVLLQKGASVKVRDRQQQTPLHRSQKPSVTKFLLHHRLRRASTMTSGLFDEARRFSSSSTSTFTTSPPNSIADQDLDIDAQDAHKKTALYLACSQGREKIVRLLLLARANPNIAAHESTPLTITIESQARSYIRDPMKKVDIVAALVSSGADPEPGKGLLRKPRGMHKEISRALEGRAGSQLLQGSSVSVDWGPEARRDSGYQPSVSSFASKPQLEHLEFGPPLTSDFGTPGDEKPEGGEPEDEEAGNGKPEG
ncbi:hypothetical protein INS49_003142 [Diaporthe citri]|uniref:uncharacterized protein n=1 Tax=Diaporthe citri TaxID=83186 RepID=UPI001C823BC6|nr:uncharacterized protein INS49_003142 [Diaporthe citri]KAG6368924.1 hypothetical protein INS49_003142 [Diaporthe citri]